MRSGRASTIKIPLSKYYQNILKIWYGHKCSCLLIILNNRFIGKFNNGCYFQGSGKCKHRSRYLQISIKSTGDKVTGIASGTTVVIYTHD